MEHGSRLARRYAALGRDDNKGCALHRVRDTRNCKDLPHVILEIVADRREQRDGGRHDQLGRGPSAVERERQRARHDGGGASRDEPRRSRACC